VDLLHAAERAILERRFGADDAPTPHPITPEHVARYRDVDLLHAAERAILERRFGAARQLLARHRRELPAFSAVEVEGLALLADCVERPGPYALGRVRAFYDRHTDSTVRRRLRRSCLDAPR
jgi:hypothetical protein